MSAAVTTGERVKWVHNGHRFTVFKTVVSPFWYFAWREGNRWRKRSTFTRDVKLAKVFAQDAWRRWLDIKAGRVVPEPEVAPREMASVNEVLECYRGGIARVSERIDEATIAKNIGALGRLLKWAGSGERGAGSLERLKADVLTAPLIDAAVTNYRVPAGSDARALDQRRRGAAAMVRQARAVFKPEALRLYKEAGLVLPDLTSFLKERPVTAPARVHRSIEVAALRKMDESARQWRASLERGAGSDQAPDSALQAISDLYLVHLCAKFLGLRASEIEGARRSWFMRAPDRTVDGREWGQWFIDVAPTAEFRQKASEGAVPVRAEIIGEFALALKHRPLRGSEQGAGSGEELEAYLIAAPDRAELIYRTHSLWLREFLPAAEFGKTNHELRRWGAQIMEGRYGKEAADAFLRHTPKTTAERHYLERSYPWSRLGNDVGIGLEDARGPEVVAGSEQVWRRGL